MMKLTIATSARKNKIILYSTTNKDGYRIYKSKKNLCENCPNLKRFTGSNTN